MGRKQRLPVTTALFGLALLISTAIRAADGVQAPEIPDEELSLTFCTNRHERHELISVDLNGEHPRRLRNERESAIDPHWSPDGKMLAFTLLRGDLDQIYVRDMTNGVEVNLSKSEHNERMPAWAPDGKRIAFVSNRSGNSELYVMNRDGTNVKVVASHPGYDADPAWSPDGNRLYFCSSRNSKRGLRLFSAEVDGKDVEEVISQDTFGWVFPDISPDGKKLAHGSLFSDNSIQLEIFDLASNDVMQCTDDPEKNACPRWSPVGRYIAYVRFNFGRDGFKSPRDFQVGERGATLMLYNVTTGKSRVVSKDDVAFIGMRPCWGRIPKNPPVKAGK
jgi:tol-pal system beta propeller repeat protein TolB